MNGFHAVGVAAVFAGVLMNANRELTCSRWLALPALLAVGTVVLLELEVDAHFASSHDWSARLAPLRNSLLVHWIN